MIRWIERLFHNNTCSPQLMAAYKRVAAGSEDPDDLAMVEADVERNIELNTDEYELQDGRTFRA